MDKISADTEVEVDQSSSSSYKEDMHVHISRRSSPCRDLTARFSDKSTVMIQITCKMQKGVFVNILTKIENLHLSITTANSMLIDETTLHATIIAQMETEFNMSSEDVVKDLHSIIS